MSFKLEVVAGSSEVIGIVIQVFIDRFPKTRVPVTLEPEIPLVDS
ncbi:MAG TPA: hypothetical protein VGK64_04470 [Bryobacteraceae bacterium]